jgi:hypothetical protein
MPPFYHKLRCGAGWNPACRLATGASLSGQEVDSARCSIHAARTSTWTAVALKERGIANIIGMLHEEKKNNA